MNLFAILTNNFGRFGHNLFIQTRKKDAGTEYGPFIFIDNDRSKWKYDLIEKGKVPKNPKDHPLATFCKFPKDIANRLIILDYLKNDGLSVGKLVLAATRVYQDVPSGTIFDETQAKYLDLNVQYITDILYHCLSKHSEEDLIFQESKQSSYSFLDTTLNIRGNIIEKSPEPFIKNFAEVTGFLPEDIKL